MNPLKYIFDLSYRQLSILTIILIFEIIGSASLYYVFNRKEDQAISRDFIALSRELTASIEKEISLDLESLYSLSALYSVTDFVSREQFKEFNAGVLDRVSSIQAFGWIPFVKSEEIAFFEANAQKDGALHFRITEKIDGELVPVLLREIYYPVFYIEPLIGNKKAFGFDLGSNQARLNALKKAIEIESLVATSRIELVQEVSNQKSILVFSPISKNGKVSEFVSGVYRIDDLMSRAVGHLSQAKCNLLVYDLNAEVGDQLLTQLNFEDKPSLPDSASIVKPVGLHFEQKIKMADREWLIQSTPTRMYLNSFVHTAKLSLIISAILSVIILYFFYGNFRKFNLHVKNQYLLETTVNERTEELQEYAHVVSHDLKSPLRNIEALVSWIKEDNLSKFEESSLQHFDHISATLEKMELLIKNILGYSSINIKSDKIQDVDLNDVINNLKSILFIPNNISIKVLSKLPVIKGEKIKLQQLFQNLISNAIKFNDKEKGIIEIDVKDKTTLYEFSVKDNGIGIERKYQEKIFQIFQVLSNSKNSTGIGLAIVKKIVAQFDGGIWVKSVFGKGSTFYFTLKKQ